MSERLDRIEQNLEALTNEVRKITEVSSRHDQQIESMNLSITSLSEQMVSLMRMFQQSITVISIMQSDIRGIQTENQRILQRFFDDNQE